MSKWFASFEIDEGGTGCRDLIGPYWTSTSSAIYAVLIEKGCEGYPNRIGCGDIDLCWHNGKDWMQTHYDWVKNEYGEYEPVEIEPTDRQMRNEYAAAAEALHDDVLKTAEEHGIDPDDIEWEDNPYDETDPDDFYFCEWESDSDQPEDEDDEN